MGPHNFAGSNAAVMNFPRYPVVTIPEQNMYKFDSEGPHGRIKKVILYQTTVAYTALDFTNRFPSAQIFVEGSTEARTRLYQIGIASDILKIRNNFEVFGLIDENWQFFRLNRKYEAFLIQRKQLRKFTT
jgi:hypothetical protein